MKRAFGAEECLPVDTIDVESVPPGSTGRFALRILTDGLSNTVHVPVIIKRGAEPGPTFGVTAAIHGNELNGIGVIHRLLREIDVKRLRGSIVACPVLNAPAFIRQQRTFAEGFDLNRVMPGREGGNIAEVYAHRLMTRLVRRFDYLVDLHTASFGRSNALYVRANLAHPVTSRMAMLQSAEIIVNNEAVDGTLRSAAMESGIPAITVEVGNPLRFQREMITDSLHGLLRVLIELEMLGPIEDLPPVEAPVICDHSYWIYTQHGGVLMVRPNVTDVVERGEVIATVSGIFGDRIARYVAEERGIVVGRTTNPVCQTGARVVHFGIVREG